MTTPDSVNSSNGTAPTSVPWININGAFKFDTTPIFTLQNAMTAIAIATQSLLGDQTQLIQGIEALSAHLVGPLSERWSKYMQAIMANDEKQVAYFGTGPGKDPNQQQTWVSQLNIDNSDNSSISTSYGNNLQALGQAQTGFTTNYGNLAQVANSVVTGLASSIVQDWVI